MRTWDFAYRQARKGPWEEHSRDQYRFKERVKNLSHIISPALDQTHRDKVFYERFSEKASNSTQLTDSSALQSVGIP